MEIKLYSCMELMWPENAFESCFRTDLRLWTAANGA